MAPTMLPGDQHEEKRKSNQRAGTRRRNKEYSLIQSINAYAIRTRGSGLLIAYVFWTLQYWIVLLVVVVRLAHNGSTEMPLERKWKGGGCFVHTQTHIAKGHSLHGMIAIGALSTHVRAIRPLAFAF